MKVIPVRNISQEYGTFGGSKFLLGGTTGSGKTTLVSLLVNQNARSIISRMVGQVSSTLKPKVFVLSGEEEFQNYIRIYAKPNEFAMDRKDFDEVIENSLRTLIRQAAKENLKHVDTAESLLTKGFTKGENHVSFVGLLKEEGETWISEIAQTLNKIPAEELRELFEIARSRVEDPEAVKGKNKHSSTSLDHTIAEVISEYLEGRLLSDIGQEVGYRIADHYNKVNELFLKLGYSYFQNHTLTIDGFLTIDLPISGHEDESLKEARDAFFCNNSNENAISIEVLYEEIIVYVGINLGLVKQLGSVSEFYKNRNGNVEFGIVDTMGAFHKYEDKIDAENYFKSLTSVSECNGVILLTPLYIGANEKKFNRLTSEFFKQFPYDLDVFIISNKADMVIEQFKLEWETKYSTNDPFSDFGSGSEVEIDPVRLREHVENTMKTIQKEVIEDISNQRNGRVQLIGHLTTSLIDPKIDTMGIDQFDNFPRTIIKMLNSFASKQDDVEKVKVEFDSNYASDIGIRFDKQLFETGVAYILDQKMFTNIYENWKHNCGKTPHGQSFHALTNNLSHGEGHSTDLHERFKYVQSIKVTFPGTIRNSLHNELNKIVDLLRKSISFEGINNLSNDLSEALLEKLASHINLRNVVISLVYTQTFLPVMTQPRFEFGSKFRSYLANVKNILANQSDSSAYADALEKEIHRAFKTLLDSDVRYVNRIS